MNLLDPTATANFSGMVPAVCDAEAGEPRSKTSIEVKQVNRKLLQVRTGSIKKSFRLIGDDDATLQD